MQDFKTRYQDDLESMLKIKSQTNECVVATYVLVNMLSVKPCKRFSFNFQQSIIVILWPLIRKLWSTTHSLEACATFVYSWKDMLSFGDTWQDILLKLLACGTFVSSSGYVSYNLRSLGKIDMYLLRYLMCKKILANDMLIIWHFSFESVCIDVKPCASLFASYRKVYILWYPYGLGDMQCMTRLCHKCWCAMLQ